MATTSFFYWNDLPLFPARAAAANGIVLSEPTYGINLKSVRGLYGPRMRYTDRPRFGAPGSFPSPHYARPKEIVMSFRVSGDNSLYGAYRDLSETASMRRIRARMQPSENTFGRLRFSDGTGTRNTRARYINCRIIDRDEGAQTPLSSSGQYTDMVVRFRAEDPNIYSELLVSRPMQVFTAEGGLDLPSTGTYPNLSLGGLDLPSTGSYPSLVLGGLDFPQSASPTTTLNNDGDQNAFLSFSLTAGNVPLRVVELVNLTTGLTSVFAARNVVQGEDWSSYPVAVPAGSTMIVDMNPNSRSVLVDGQPRFELWQLPRTPMFLQPDDNNLKYIPDTPEGGVLTVNYRHTWI